MSKNQPHRPQPRAPPDDYSPTRRAENYSSDDKQHEFGFPRFDQRPIPRDPNDAVRDEQPPPPSVPDQQLKTVEAESDSSPSPAQRRAYELLASKVTGILRDGPTSLGSRESVPSTTKSELMARTRQDVLGQLKDQETGTKISATTPRDRVYAVSGVLFDQEGNATRKLTQLLRGLAKHISKTYDPADGVLVTPGKMKMFYARYSVSDEIYPWQSVFDDRVTSISNMFLKLRIRHHFVQERGDMQLDVPALTPAGFVSWILAVIKAHPDLEYERLSQVVKDIPIRDPSGNTVLFPSGLLRSQFPSHGDTVTALELRNSISAHSSIPSIPSEKKTIFYAKFDDGVPTEVEGEPSSTQSTNREYEIYSITFEEPETDPNMARPGNENPWDPQSSKTYYKSPTLSGSTEQQLHYEDTSSSDESDCSVKQKQPTGYDKNSFQSNSLLLTPDWVSPPSAFIESGDLDSSPAVIQALRNLNYMPSDLPTDLIRTPDIAGHVHAEAPFEPMSDQVLDESRQDSTEAASQLSPIEERPLDELLSLEDKTSAGAHSNIEQTSVDTSAAARSGQGKTQRVYWICSCGEQLYDDYTELEAGSIEKLKIWLQAQHPNPRKHYLGGILRWMMPTSFPRSTQTSQATVSRRDATSSSSVRTDFNPTQQTPFDANILAVTNPMSSSATSSTAMPAAIAAPTVSYLLLCIPKGLLGHRLEHLQIIQQTTGYRNSTAHHITNDRELFKSLRKKYTSERKLFISRFWPKIVIRVSLAYFLVDAFDYVDLKHYACRQTTADRCKCIPPQDLIQPSPNAQYSCSPRDPPLMPPIGTNYLTHYFQDQDCIKSDEVAKILNQLPKRMGQCMVTPNVVQMEGWGLEFEEGWDPGFLRTAILIIALLGSLIFGILWAVLEKDPQTAFTISAFVVGSFATLCAYTAAAEPRSTH